MQTYISIHNHTEYSKLDGKSNPKKLASKAKEFGMNALAISDHRNMDGMVPFYQACTDKKKGVGIKPILGCEVEHTEDRTIRSRADRKALGHKNYHLLLLAKDEIGHKNLMKIVTDAATVGKFDNKERTDFKFIQENNLGKGLYATTACIGGQIPYLILQGKQKEAETALYQMMTLFDQVFLEIQPHSSPEQKLVNDSLVSISKSHKLPLVIATDSHYITPEEKDIHDTLLCMQTAADKVDPKRFRFPPGYDVHFWSPDDIWNWVKQNNYPEECITNTIQIAKDCNVELKFHQRIMPHAEIPAGFTDEAEYLRHICNNRIWEYINKHNKVNRTQEYIARMEYELGVICSKGYASYFLILGEIVQFCKDHGIAVGPGRGSAAASFVARLLRITGLDPIELDLTFERFLNPERDSMPDIDTDIDYFRRPEVIEFCKQRYIHVAQIANNITNKLRSCIQSVFRVYGKGKTGEELKKLIPAKINQVDTTWDMMKEIHDNPKCDLANKIEDHEVKAIVENFKKLNEELAKYDPRIKRDILALEGVVRGSGIHAGGVLLCDRPIEEFAPLATGSDTAVIPVCSLNMKAVDEIGLLKVDLLGSRNMSIIDQAAKEAGIDLETIPMDDPKVWKGFQDGYYHAIFQMQSAGMTKLAKDLQLKEFDELVNLLALFRPGPLKGIIDTANGTTMVQQYIINTKDSSQIKYEHPDLEPILGSSKAMLIFQEQLMLIVQKFAGYSLGGADLWRRVVGKKDAKLLQSLKDEFINGSYEMEPILDMEGQPLRDETGKVKEQPVMENGQAKIKVPGCVRLGYPAALGEYLYALMEFFAGYGFNKAHSAAYALSSYRTMYLKVYFAVEFMRAVLSSEMDTLEKTTENLKECKRLGIKILPPDINNSEFDFIIETDPITGEKAIRYGLSAVKMIGEGHVARIRANRPFTDLANFATTVPGKGFDRRHVYNLIKSGSLDQFNTNRYTLLNQYNFDIRGSKEVSDPNQKMTANEAYRFDETTWDKKIALEWEKELLGTYVTGHPFEELPYSCKWEYVMPKGEVEYGGQIRKVNVITTQGGDQMAFFTLETAHDMRDVTVFPTVWAKHQNKIKDKAMVIVRGKRDASRDTILANEVVSATKSARSKANKSSKAPSQPLQMPAIDAEGIYFDESQISPVPLPAYIPDCIPEPVQEMESYLERFGDDLTQEEFNIVVEELNARQHSDLQPIPVNLPPIDPALLKSIEKEREKFKQQQLLLSMYS